jgi:hypothetical protein
MARRAGATAFDMTFRPLLGTFLMTTCVTGLAGCGDDATDSGSATAGETGTSTGDSPTTGTGVVPTTGDTTGDATGDATGDTSGSGGETSTTGGEAISCDALELSSELVDAGAWDPGLTISGFAGLDGFTPGVHDFARGPDGAVLAAGYFRYLGQQVVRPLVRREADGWQAEPLLKADLERPEISAIAVDDQGRVAIATYTAMPADLGQRDGEILLADGGDFEVIGEFKGAVRTLAWYDGELWVAGVFSLAGGEAAGLAVHDGKGWSAPPGGPLVGDGAYELTVAGDELLVGGHFSGVGGIAAQSVAAWDGMTWSAFDLPDGTALALARDGAGELYAGGLFSAEGSVETGGIARWSNGAWQSVAGGLSNPTFRGVVGDLAVHDDGLYVAGCFTAAGGVPSDPSAVPAAGLARWTGDTWEPLADPAAGVGSAWFSPLKCGDEGPAAVWEMQHQRLFVDGDRVYLGGFFPGVDGTPSQSVAAYENGQWVAQGEPGRGFSGATRTLAVGGPECSVHVMGGVTHAGADPVDRRVMRDDGGAWTPVGPPVPPEMYCWQFAVDGAGAPFLGCDQPPVGDEPPPGVVLRVVDDAWQPLGEPFAQGGVATVAFDSNGALWAAGGASEGFVARSEGEWIPLGSFDGRVGALALRPTQAGQPVEAVVGGYFTSVEGMQVGGVARWNGAAWEPLGDGIFGSVLAVAYAEDGTIYASTADDGTPDRMILARWDGAEWTDVAQPEPGPVPAGYSFSSLVARSGYVVASGFAWPNSGERNIFVWDGQSFHSLRGGATAISVDAAVLAKNGLWFGGTIAEAGPPDARLSSVGIAHLE